jgi:hypothetical protein
MALRSRSRPARRPARGAAGSGAAPALSLERRRQGHARGAPRRHDPEQEAGEDRGDAGESQDHGVDADLLGARQPVGACRGQEIDAPPGEQQPEAAAEHGEQQALDHEQAHEARSAGAEGHAHGDLAPARHAPDQQQVGEIGAGDEEHEAHRTHEDEQGRPHRTDHLRLERQQPRAVLGDPVAAQARRERIRLTRRRRQVDPRGQPADGVDEVQPARGTGFIDEQGHDDVASRSVLEVPGQDGVEPGRQHADDGERGAAERHGAAQDFGIGGEVRAPQAVADQGDRGGAMALVLGSEAASEHGLHTEHGQEVRRHAQHPEVLGALPAEDEGAAEPDAEIGEDLATRAPVDVFGIRDRCRGIVRLQVPEEDQALRLRERQRPHQDRVNDAEHRRRGADAEPEGQHGDRGEPGTVPQHAQTLPEVLTHPVPHDRLLPVRRRRRTYSVRMATMGSTRAACRAGSQHPASATAHIASVAAAKDGGSAGDTPKRIPASAWQSANAPRRPRPMPIPASAIPWRRTRASTSARRAPSAMRMPISRVRRPTS